MALSVNVNKIALIRNSREGNNPDLVAFAARCLDYGAHGITVHPRPDQRHIRPEDCIALAALLRQRAPTASTDTAIEFNIEGNPAAGPCAAMRDDFSDYPGFIEIVEQCQPQQATLVPDSSAQLTSDHGFDLINGNDHDNRALQTAIARIKLAGARVSLFMDADTEQITRARDVGADRIELYTGPYAHAVASGDAQAAERIFAQHVAAAEHAHKIGLGVNAGHDLNLDNLSQYRQLPSLAEVSIGHAITVDALSMGLETTVRRYLQVLALAA
ncbi:MAG: pyridoxine 5'-phosphate synthase [Gammaproteobacteria bacterium]|nr:pyridoxine 5'-phosphate synthase [Gammaproteobacteria bacterium]MBT8151777.1 pyridoxine 5'-phosphate synthase [Gammaproteobacteria bacterium]NND39416.1 pyridoxine 5'-phosphate synthase [Pseudomonadales bacterium]NNL10512.1 pyridoxine 5'-phosphate synthase [Pseudomonadales bacterium]NNM10758.1 pyridoxine 5'-phosphate synthase [Pseudomonadales bacterium]